MSIHSVSACASVEQTINALADGPSVDDVVGVAVGLAGPEQPVASRDTMARIPSTRFTTTFIPRRAGFAIPFMITIWVTVHSGSESAVYAA